MVGKFIIVSITHEFQEFADEHQLRSGKTRHAFKERGFNRPTSCVCSIGGADEFVPFLLVKWMHFRMSLGQVAYPVDVRWQRRRQRKDNFVGYYSSSLEIYD